MGSVMSTRKDLHSIVVLAAVPLLCRCCATQQNGNVTCSRADRKQTLNPERACALGCNIRQPINCSKIGHFERVALCVQTFAGLEKALAGALSILEREEGFAATGLAVASAAPGAAKNPDKKSDSSAAEGGDAPPQLSHSGGGRGVSPAAEAAAPSEGKASLERRPGTKLRVLGTQPRMQPWQRAGGPLAAEPIDAADSRSAARGGSAGGAPAAPPLQAERSSGAALGAAAESAGAARARATYLLEFLAALERRLHAAFEGSLARDPPPGPAASFFIQNRKVELRSWWKSESHIETMT